MPQGILNINKPRGVTSFSVVSRVRRLTKVRRVGHAGTLDPLADGVLPICLGPATRIVEYLVDAPKAYFAAIRLGAATDTYDAEGTVTATGDPSAVTAARIEEELGGFRGRIEQLPPMYSALKHEGRPLYEYARAGKEAPRRPRPVMVYRLELLRFEPPVAEVEIECGRGAYVRTLAHDLGERLGCYGHVEQLTRLASGPFSLAGAVSPDAFEAAVAEDRWQELLSPVDRVLESWHAALLGEEHTRDVRQGHLLVLDPVRDVSALAKESPCRAYSAEGDFLAILRYRGENRWHPEKVFSPL